MSVYDGNQPMKQIFEKIYSKELWGKGKGSGTGSSPEYCKKYIVFIEKELATNDYGAVIDFGCGDWQLAKAISWENVRRYIGIDVVQRVVDGASQLANSLDRYEVGQFKFECEDFSDPGYVKDLLIDYSQYEPILVLCKDVLQHWPDDIVTDFLQALHDWMPSGSKSIITNNYQYIRSPEKNSTLRSVENRYRWAPIDLTKPPFDVYGYKAELYYPRREKMVCTKLHNS